MSDNPLLRGQALSLRTNAHSYQADRTTRGDRDSLGDLIAGMGHQLQLWDAVGYPNENELIWEVFWTRYHRTGPGHGIVEKFVGDTWQTIPGVDDDHDGDGETDFEQKVDELFKSKGLRKGPGHWLRVADKMATMGKYSVLVLGLNDGKDPDQPVEGHDDPDTKPFNGLDDLMFVGAYSEDDVLDYDVEDDFTDERFRLPTEYTIQVDDDGNTEDFHHSRVIHIAQNVFDNPLEGIPFLKPITHELLNIDKILAASAEGYWRGAYQGIVITPPTNSDGVPMKFADGSGPQDSSELVKQIQQYEQNFRRTLTSTGDVETLDASISAPTEHLEAQYRSISTALDAPMSILMGNETGERATQEDRSMWDERIHNRRIGHAEPSIYRQFIDTNVDYGILPEPDGGTYDVEWQSLEEPTDMEEAERLNVVAQTIERLSGGTPSSLFTTPELRKISDHEPEVGSEVDDSINQRQDLPPDPEAAMPPDEQLNGADAADGPDVPDERTNTFADEPVVDRSELDGEGKWHSEDEPAA